MRIAVGLATMSAGPQADPSAFGQLTCTEALIRQEIIRLGGDWESGKRPQLVAFVGPKFEPRHYEMLTHLPDVSFFSATDTTIDAYGLSCISQINNVDRIDIVRCRVVSGSVSVLRASRRLNSLWVESSVIHDEFFGEFSELVNLRTVVLEDIQIPEGLVDELAKMHWLKTCQLIRCRGLSDADMQELKKALPTTEF